MSKRYLKCDAEFVNALAADRNQIKADNDRLRKRLDRFEAFAKAHEAWEARLILEGEQKILDNISRDAYDQMMKVGGLRNQAMKD